MQIREQVDLRHCNTFHVAARARWFGVATSNAELAALLQWARERQQPLLVLGQGSNVLLRQDWPGLVIQLQTRGMCLIADHGREVEIEAMGGEIWHDFVLWTLAQGCYGLENLALIPGTVGAAPVQNIGAYGVELQDHVLSLEAMDTATGALRRFSAAECGFAYRDSVFKQALAGRYIICSVRFRLSRQPQLKLGYPALRQALAGQDPATLTPRQVSDAVCGIRRSKLPDPAQLGNAGSFFRNPHVSQARFNELRKQWPALPGHADADGVKIPAAWLIEQAGWKGWREGDAGVHHAHALVLVNHGEASGADLLALAERIMASVQQRFGILLEPEVRIV